jgi:signal recognition particle subunit SRP54
MFDNLSQKFSKVLKYLKGEAKLTEENIKIAMREIKLSLLEADVNFKVVKQFINNIKEKSLGKDVQDSLNPYQHVVKIVQEEIIDILGSKNQELNIPNAKPAKIMLVGLQGTGKTTTAGKLAYHLQEQGKTPILCSLDLKRLAAGEQLAVIAKEIGCKHFQPTSDKTHKIIKELIKTAKDYGYDYIIADTAGRLHIDDELMDELAFIKDRLQPDEVIFVADSLTGQDAVQSALNFSQRIGIDSIILTKLDADSRGGAALSIVSITGKPIKFAGMGERYQDLQKFYPDRLASTILGMGDVLTLIERAEKTFDEEQAEKMAKKLLKNQFTLEDFKMQLSQVQKLGSMGDILNMMPGMVPGEVKNADVDENRIKHTIAIINSMTKKEKNNPKIIDGRRRIRISKGSGRPVQEINQLLKSYFEIKKYMKKPFFRKMLKRFDFFSKMG